MHGGPAILWAYRLFILAWIINFGRICAFGSSPILSHVDSVENAQNQTANLHDALQAEVYGSTKADSILLHGNNFFETRHLDTTGDADKFSLEDLKASSQKLLRVLYQGDLTNYPTYAQTNAIFEELLKTFPKWIRKFTIGFSVEKRPIYAYHVGLGPVEGLDHRYFRSFDGVSGTCAADAPFPSPRNATDGLRRTVGSNISYAQQQPQENLTREYPFPEFEAIWKERNAVQKEKWSPGTLLTALHHAREPASLTVLLYFVIQVLHFAQAQVNALEAPISTVDTGPVLPPPGATSWDELRGDLAGRNFLARSPPPLQLTQDLNAKKYIASALDQATYTIYRRPFVVVPFMNPDGYVAIERLRRKDIRKNQKFTCPGRKNRAHVQGVDLNRNYDYAFNSFNSPCDAEEYEGPRPFSEPETQAIRCLIENSWFRTALNFHGYGGFWTRPYNCCPTKNLTETVAVVYDELKRSIQVGDFGSAPTIELLSYATTGEAICQGENLRCSQYCFVADDWMLAAHGILAMSPEVGADRHGFWPPPHIVEEINKEQFWHIMDVLAKGSFALQIIFRPAGGLEISSDSGHKIFLNNHGLDDYPAGAWNTVVVVFSAPERETELVPLATSAVTSDPPFALTPWSRPSFHRRRLGSASEQELGQFNILRGPSNITFSAADVSVTSTTASAQVEKPKGTAGLVRLTGTLAGRGNYELDSRLTRHLRKGRVICAVENASLVDELQYCHCAAIPDMSREQVYAAQLLPTGEKSPICRRARVLLQRWDRAQSKMQNPAEIIMDAVEIKEDAPVLTLASSISDASEGGIADVNIAGNFGELEEQDDGMVDLVGENSQTSFSFYGTPAPRRPMLTEIDDDPIVLTAAQPRMPVQRTSALLGPPTLSEMSYGSEEKLLVAQQSAVGNTEIKYWHMHVHQRLFINMFLILQICLIIGFSVLLLFILSASNQSLRLSALALTGSALPALTVIYCSDEEAAESTWYGRLALRLAAAVSGATCCLPLCNRYNHRLRRRLQKLDKSSDQQRILVVNAEDDPSFSSSSILRSNEKQGNNNINALLEDTFADLEQQRGVVEAAGKPGGRRVAPSSSSARFETTNPFEIVSPPSTGTETPDHHLNIELPIGGTSRAMGPVAGQDMRNNLIFASSTDR